MSHYLALLQAIIIKWKSVFKYVHFFNAHMNNIMKYIYSWISYNISYTYDTNYCNIVWIYRLTILLLMKHQCESVCERKFVCKSKIFFFSSEVNHIQMFARTTHIRSYSGNNRFHSIGLSWSTLNIIRTEQRTDRNRYTITWRNSAMLSYTFSFSLSPSLYICIIL